jgi:hypothetical protein
MLSDVSDRQNEENRLARAWIGSGGGAWARFVDFIVGVVELLAGLVGLIVVTVSYDSGIKTVHADMLAPTGGYLYLGIRRYFTSTIAPVAAGQYPTIDLPMAHQYPYRML